jgi:hypothetical protein
LKGGAARANRSGASTVPASVDQQDAATEIQDKAVKTVDR